MKTIPIASLLLLAAVMAGCAGPNARIGEQAVLMHAASFGAAGGETLEQRQLRLMRVQANAYRMAYPSRYPQ